MSTFSQRIKNLRDSKAWSKSKTAQMLGVSAQRYSNWEYDLHEPDYEMLNQIAALFETTTDYLTGKSDNPSSESTAKDGTALTWSDLDMPMPYGGKLPDELKSTYADIAKGYFKRHPEMLNKDE